MTDSQGGLLSPLNPLSPGGGPGVVAGSGKGDDPAITEALGRFTDPKPYLSAMKTFKVGPIDATVGGRRPTIECAEQSNAGRHLPGRRAGVAVNGDGR